jgi:prolipoprotein diacylglyceryltransferase
MFWSPWIILLALLAGGYLARKRQNQLPISSSDRISINVAAFCGAMIGARLPFWLESGLVQSNWSWLSDGKTILGGIFGAYIVVEIVKEFRGIRISTGDSFALPAAVMIGIARLSCFTSGCCYGRITELPWGIRFNLANDPVGVIRHPTQLYEVIFHSLAAAAIVLAERCNWLQGNRLKAYLIAYLSYRFLSEWLRPEPKWLLDLTAYQWASLLMILLLSIQWAIHSRRKPVSPSLPESASSLSQLGRNDM